MYDLCFIWGLYRGLWSKGGLSVAQGAILKRSESNQGI